MLYSAYMEFPAVKVYFITSVKVLPWLTPLAVAVKVNGNVPDGVGPDLPELPPPHDRSNAAKARPNSRRRLGLLRQPARVIAPKTRQAHHTVRGINGNEAALAVVVTVNSTS